MTSDQLEIDEQLEIAAQQIAAALVDDAKRTRARHRERAFEPTTGISGPEESAYRI